MANTTSKANRATTMADLMKSAKTTFVSVRKGEVLPGVVTKLTSAEILVDIGSKTEAVVLEKERRILKNLLATLKVGDKVFVSVLNPESDFGNSVVSLRRFIDDKLWVKLEELQKKKEVLEATVDELTKGGFLITTKDGISGFLPNSHASYIENSQNLIGQTLKVVVFELNRTLRKIIFSQKALLGKEDFEKAVKNLKIDEKIEAIISNVAPFGIFVSIKADKDTSVEGFVHISEIAWEKIPTVPEIYKPGDKLEAQIIGFDKEGKRVNLSIKRLSKDPFEQKLNEYTVDRKVTGKITEIISAGILVDLGEGIEGMIKKDKIPPKSTYKEGADITATVASVDKKKHRVLLVPVLTEKPIGYR